MKHECPICKHEFESNIFESIPDAPLEVELRHIAAEESLNYDKSYLVMVKKIEYHYVPVEAESEEEAQLMANAALDKYSEEYFRDEYYDGDEEWEFKVESLKQSAYLTHRDFLIKKATNENTGDFFSGVLK